jgi:hypothetical protein
VRNCVDWSFPCRTLETRTHAETPALAFGVHCSVVKELPEARVDSSSTASRDTAQSVPALDQAEAQGQGPAPYRCPCQPPRGRVRPTGGPTRLQVFRADCNANRPAPGGISAAAALARAEDPGPAALPHLQKHAVELLRCERNVRVVHDGPVEADTALFDEPAALLVRRREPGLS